MLAVSCIDHRSLGVDCRNVIDCESNSSRGEHMRASCVECGKCRVGRSVSPPTYYRRPDCIGETTFVSGGGSTCASYAGSTTGCNTDTNSRGLRASSACPHCGSCYGFPADNAPNCTDDDFTSATGDVCDDFHPHTASSSYPTCYTASDVSTGVLAYRMCYNCGACKQVWNPTWYSNDIVVEPQDSSRSLPFVSIVVILVIALLACGIITTQ